MRSLLLLLTSALLLGNAPAPDVLLVTIDTLRADHLGCYGSATARTPMLDELAAAGVRYATCQSPAPITLPSHASILTGQMPATHGVRNNSTYRLGEGIPTLAEALRAAGYHTGAFVAALPLAARYGLYRGFEMYDDTAPPVAAAGYHFPERSAALVSRATHTWVSTLDAKTPLFLWVHFFEPHYPYKPPPPFDQQFPDAPYDGEVAAADAALRYLLAGLDRIRGDRPRLTVVTGDHGEGLGEHDENTHTMFLFDTTQHVPLIFHWPGQLAPLVETEPVASIDIAPTILSMLSLPMSLDAEGIALTPGETPPRRPLFAETLYPLEAYGWAPAFSLREGTRKVIRSNVSRAYDLDADPHEKTNLLEAKAPDWATEMLSRLDAQVASETTESATHRPSEEELQALASLGYVGGGLGQADSDLLAALDRPDASDRIDESLRFAQIQEDVGTGKPQKALEELQTIEGLHDNAWAMILQGQALEALGRNAEAIAAYEDVDRLWPDREEIVLRMARLHRVEGDDTNARRYYERAHRLEPDDRQLFFEIAEYFELQGDVARRDALFDEASRDPRCPPVLKREVELARRLTGDRTAVLRARQRWRLYDWPEMVEILGTRELRGNAEAQQYLGVAYHMMGNVDEAVGAYRRALTLDDSLHLAHNNLAWELGTHSQRFDEALMHARRAVEIFPEEAEYQETLLEILEHAGRGQEAKQHLASILPEFLGDQALQRRAHRYGL